jgi:methyl-accepting chemotaxis protein
MNASFDKLNLKKKLLLLPALFFIGLLALQLTNFSLQKQVRQKVVLPGVADQVLKGDVSTLKAAVEVEAATLSVQVKTFKTREEQVAFLVAQTDPVRFLDDRSGYFFVYDLSGTRINVPINKSQNNKNLMDLTDKAGFRFVEGFVKVAKAGGGTVDYWFEREGKGVQLKHSYVAPLSGTDFLIGCGVYLDNVETEQAALAQAINAKNGEYSLYTLYVFLGILALGVAVSCWLSGSVSHSIRQISDQMLASADQVTFASTQVAATSQSLADGASDQAAAIEETSSSLEVLTASSKDNHKGAQVDQLAAGSAQASQAQSENLDQINTAIGRMNQVTQNTAASAEESAAAAEQLRAQAQTMKDAVLELAKLAGGSQNVSGSQSLAVPGKTTRRSDVARLNGPANGKSKSSTNGHSAAKPVKRATAEASIPMGGDFREF